MTTYPWQPGSSKTGSRAIGDLGVGLMNSLKTVRGIHTETLLTVIGALAGFAAQNAALNVAASGTSSSATPRSFAVVSTKPGEIFLYGDAINVFLFPESGSTLPLGAPIAGAAVNAGVKEVDLPNTGEIAAHVASVLGGAEFGKLRLRTGVEPQLQPLAALLRYWPKTRDVLARPRSKDSCAAKRVCCKKFTGPSYLGWSRRSTLP